VDRRLERAISAFTRKVDRELAVLPRLIRGSCPGIEQKECAVNARKQRWIPVAIRGVQCPAYLDLCFIATSYFHETHALGERDTRSQLGLTRRSRGGKAGVEVRERLWKVATPICGEAESALDAGRPCQTARALGVIPQLRP
jgi:hypothetical protein